MCRTNNSLEGWHRSFNSLFRAYHPPLSEFVKIMKKEDNHWRILVEDFNNNPINGIKGKVINIIKNIFYSHLREWIEKTFMCSKMQHY